MFILRRWCTELIEKIHLVAPFAQIESSLAALMTWLHSSPPLLRKYTDGIQRSLEQDRERFFLGDAKKDIFGIPVLHKEHQVVIAVGVLDVHFAQEQKLSLDLTIYLRLTQRSQGKQMGGTQTRFRQEVRKDFLGSVH
jgi:hypothetical protein